MAATAYELGIGESTVRQHLSGLYRRTGHLNAAQAAYRLGAGRLELQGGRRPRLVGPSRLGDVVPVPAVAYSKVAIGGRTLDWSPDGRAIAALAGTESQGGIWEFAVDGSTARIVSGTLEVDSPAYAPAVPWPGRVGAIALLEAGGTPEKLAGFGGADWSPDGRYIMTTDNSTSGQIVIIDRDGEIVARIEAPPHAVSWQRLPG